MENNDKSSSKEDHNTSDSSNSKNSNSSQNKDSQVKDNNESQSEEEVVEEVLEAIPEDSRDKVERVIKRTMISGVMQNSNPISEKVTEEHISSIISNSHEQDKRNRKENNYKRYYNIALILIGLIFISFLIIYLQQNVDLLIKIIIGIISFIGGYGFGRSQWKGN